MLSGVQDFTREKLVKVNESKEYDESLSVNVKTPSVLTWIVLLLTIVSDDVIVIVVNDGVVELEQVYIKSNDIMKP